MNSKERIWLTLQHKEPDRIPFDLGSSIVTGLNKIAYQNILRYLDINIAEDEIELQYERSEIVKIEEEVLRRFKVDTRGLFPNVYGPQYWAKERLEDERYYYIVDEYGIKWNKPKDEGHFYDVFDSPLKDINSLEDLKNYNSWARVNPSKIKGLKEQAIKLSKQTDCAFVLENDIIEVFTTPFILRGFTNFYIDLALNPKLVCFLMDKMLELQLEYWKLAIQELAGFDLIIRTADDLGSQTGLLISPAMYRKYIKPRHKKLFESIKGFSKNDLFIFYHCDGAISELIPDFIEIGVDILNPVQYSAAGMDTKILKEKYGKEISFWGGGIDTQNILPNGTPAQVKNEVKKRINDLAPDGGFVFGAVHNIQYDTPAENFIAMWEALQEYGRY